MNEQNYKTKGMSLEGICMSKAKSLSKLASGFKSDIVVHFRERRGNPKNPVDILKLAILDREDVFIDAVGSDAQSASLALKNFIDNN